MNRRTPYISIIIISDNNIGALSKCLESIKTLNHCEIIIVNNYFDDRTSKEMSNYLDSLKDVRIVFYQSNIELSRNALRNLALSFSSGNWLFFVKDTDIFTKNFVDFLSRSKLNPQMHFYRIQKINSSNKKERFSLFKKKKYYSMDIETFLINGEWLIDSGYQFYDNLKYGPILPFINYLYNYKNVNFFDIKKLYGVVNTVDDNLYNDDLDAIFNSLYQTTIALLNFSRRNYKQYLIILFYDVYKKRFKKDKINKDLFFNHISQMSSEAKIRFWNYFNFGFMFFFKTFFFRMNIFKKSMN